MDLSILLLIGFLVGYLFGSIPFGFLLTKYCSGQDIRTLGSGNIGATNVLRTGNKKLAAMTLLLDSLKGLLAVLLMKGLHMPQDMVLFAAAGAIVGHIFPVWLKFKGGKGVATALGILLAISWPVALIWVAVWLITAKIFKYSSLAAILSISLTPFLTYYFNDGKTALLTTFVAILILIKHTDNIKRLVSGKESKIGPSPAKNRSSSKTKGSR